MNEKSAKKILYLSKVTLGLLGACLIILFDYLDYNDLKNKNDYTGLLVQLNETPTAQLDCRHNEHKIMAWITNNRSEAAAQYIEARKKISALLLLAGSRGDELSYSKGYAPKQENNFAALFPENESDEVIDEERTQEEFRTVEQVMKSFNRHAQPVKLRVLSGVDTAALKAKFVELALHRLKNKPGAGHDEVVDEDPFTFFKYTFKFDGLKCKADTITLMFTENAGYSQMVAGGGANTKVSVRADFTSLVVPPVLFYQGFDSVMVKELREDKLLQENILSQYGKSTVNQLRGLFGKLLDKNTRSVSVLGIDLSRRWFPFAMIFAGFIINFMLLRIMTKAKKESLGSFGAHEYDDVLDWLVNNSFIRAFLWIGAPLMFAYVAVYTSFVTYSGLYYSIFLLTSLASLVSGAVAYRYSLKK